jgi:uncharacterized protein (TIGR00730 family)
METQFQVFLSRKGEVVARFDDVKMGSQLIGSDDECELLVTGVPCPSKLCQLHVSFDRKVQQPNRYLDRWVEFRHFYVRKLMLVKYSYAFVVMPGGFGTLDETFETLTLLQTGKIREFPLIFVGRTFWEPLVGFLKSTPISRGTLDGADLARFVVTDSPEEAVAEIREQAMHRFGLTYGPRAKPRWYLGER